MKVKLLELMYFKTLREKLEDLLKCNEPVIEIYTDIQLVI